MARGNRGDHRRPPGRRTWLPARGDRIPNRKAPSRPIVKEIPMDSARPAGGVLERHRVWGKAAAPPHSAAACSVPGARIAESAGTCAGL